MKCAISDFFMGFEWALIAIQTFRRISSVGLHVRNLFFARLRLQASVRFLLNSSYSAGDISRIILRYFRPFMPSGSVRLAQPHDRVFPRAKRSAANNRLPSAAVAVA